MLLPRGLACDICGAPIKTEPGAKVHKFNIEGVEEDLHCCEGECFAALGAARASGEFSDLPPSSPLRRWAEGSDDPWADLREAQSQDLLH